MLLQPREIDAPDELTSFPLGVDIFHLVLFSRIQFSNVCLDSILIPEKVSPCIQNNVDLFLLFLSKCTNSWMSSNSCSLIDLCSILAVITLLAINEIATFNEGTTKIINRLTSIKKLMRSTPEINGLYPYIQIPS